jgi:hypothetical protein
VRARRITVLARAGAAFFLSAAAFTVQPASAGLASAPAPEWRSLTLLDGRSTHPASTFAPRADGSLVVPGEGADKENYTLQFDGLPSQLTALRLDVLPDPALPGGGPGRQHKDMVLTEVLASLGPKGSSRKRPLALQRPSASHAQEGFPAFGPIDGVPTTGWAVGPKFDQPHHWVAEFSKPADVADGDVLVLELQFQFGGHTAAGCLKASVTDSPTPVRADGGSGEVDWVAVQPRINGAIDRPPRIDHVVDVLHVQPLAPRLAVDALEVADLARLAGRERVPLRAAGVWPPVERRGDPARRIDDRPHAGGFPIDERVGHEVHSGALVRRLDPPLAQGRVVDTRRVVALRRVRLRHQGARCALASLEFMTERLDRRASSTSILPYFVFQRRIDAQLIPCLRRRSSTGSSDSASRNAPMICSSVNRLFRIGAVPQFPGHLLGGRVLPISRRREAWGPSEARRAGALLVEAQARRGAAAAAW